MNAQGIACSLCSSNHIFGELPLPLRDTMYRSCSHDEATHVKTDDSKMKRRTKNRGINKILVGIRYRTVAAVDYLMDCALYRTVRYRKFAFL